MTSTLSVCLLGCGKIGSLLDEAHRESLSESFCLTHAGALTLHPAYELVGCFDVESDRREACSKTWSIPTSYSSLDDALADRHDIYVIATPNQTHVTLLQKVLAVSPRFVVCEKPLVEVGGDLTVVRDAISRSESGLIVNFTRRFDRTHRQIARRIHGGEFGSLQHFSCAVGKGLVHNGSHLIDLLQWFFQGVSRITAVSPKAMEQDIAGTFLLELPSGVVGTVIVAEQPAYSLFEADFYFERGRVTLDNIGLDVTIRKPCASKRYEGFTHLEEGETLPATLPGAMYQLYDLLSTESFDYKKHLSAVFDSAALLADVVKKQK